MIIQDHPHTLFVECHFYKWLDGKEFDSYIEAVREYRTELDYQGLLLRTIYNVTRATFEFWWRTQRLAVHGLPKLLATAKLQAVAGQHGVDPALALENERIAAAVARGAHERELYRIFTEEF